jgi:phage-related protein
VHEEKSLSVAFFRSKSGAEPVKQWLQGLPREDRQRVGQELRLVEMGWPMGMPLCRPLGDGLWEVRCSLGGNRIARVLFCIAEGSMILLHGFMKKTRKTPDDALNLAKARKKEVERG